MSGLEQLRTGMLAAIDHPSDRNRTPALPGDFASNVAHRANNLVAGLNPRSRNRRALARKTRRTPHTPARQRNHPPKRQRS